MATILRPSLDRWLRDDHRNQNFVVDDFATLSSRWVVQNGGTLAVAGGALQAATLGDWLNNLVANGEFTTDTAGWSPNAVNVSREDSELDPGANSGGNDKWCAKLEKTNTSAFGRIEQTVGLAQGIIYGCTYHATARSYFPSSNTNYFSQLYWASDSAYGAGIPDDAWGALSLITVADVGDILVFNFYAYGNTIGDVFYYDAASLRRRNTPALLAGWRSPNHVATLSHVSPAAGVVPFGYICRYTDSLNYWEVRVLPNTAGNDLRIVQVTAGAETTRAEADIDWTSDDTDELEVTCSGSTISTAYRKSGASVWTAGPSYASATQGQTSPHLGVMLYESGVGRLAGFDVRRA